MKILKFNELTIQKEIGKGGEGKAFLLESGKVYKEYYENKLTNEKIEKIKLLIKSNLNKKGITLPEAFVSKNGQIVGYIMAGAKGSELKRSLLIRPIFQKRFPNWTRLELVKTALNILEKIEYLHQKDIILGDINPQNIMINSYDDVYLVDTDSYQIKNFSCPVGTIEYTAPEIQGKKYSDFLRTKNQEYFAVATLLFTILMPGQLPYTALGSGTVQEAIKNKTFSYPLGDDINWKTPKGNWEIIWNDFSYELKEAFYNVFKLDKRLNINEWIKILKLYKNDIQNNEVSKEIFPSMQNKITENISTNMRGRAGEGKARKLVPGNLKGNKLAVIELSTKAVKLLIRGTNDLNKTFNYEDFSEKNGGYREGILTHTGKGLDAKNYMDMKYFENRVEPAIRKVVNIAKKNNVKYIYTVATAAIRSAKNKREILDLLKNKYNLNCRILSKEEEAKITNKAFLYSGSIKEAGKKLLKGQENKNILSIDQGGGSTEVVLYRDLKKTPIHNYSINLGTTVLMNLLQVNSNKNTPLKKGFTEIKQYINKKLTYYFKNYVKDSYFADECLAVGSAITKATGKQGNKKQHGSILTITQLKEKIIKIEKALIERYNNIGELSNEIRKSDNRKKNIVEDLIVQQLGLYVYLNIMNKFKVNKLVVNGTGLWYGVYFTALEELTKEKVLI